DRAFLLGDGNDQGSPFAAVLGRVVPDISESLNYHALSFYSFRQAQRPHIFLVTAGFAEGKVDSSSGRLPSPPDASLGNGLSRHTRQPVELAGMDRHIGIGNPGHFSLAGSIIGSGNIDARSDEVLLRQFVRVAASYPLDLLGGIPFCINLHRPLRSSVGHV